MAGARLERTVKHQKSAAGAELGDLPATRGRP